MIRYIKSSVSIDANLKSNFNIFNGVRFFKSVIFFLTASWDL